MWDVTLTETDVNDDSKDCRFKATTDDESIDEFVLDQLLTEELEEEAQK